MDGTFAGGLYGARSRTAAWASPTTTSFDAEFPQELKDKIEELKAGIIDGSVSVDPADYPA